jgi:apolipoprotein N-acyltransferase
MSGSLGDSQGVQRGLARRTLILRYVIAAAAGFLWAMAFPRWNVAGFAWIAPGMILLAGSGCTSRTRFRLGYTAGVVHALAGLHWLLYMPVDFFPILGWISLCAYLGLYCASWAWLCWRLFPGERPPSTDSPHLSFRFESGQETTWAQRSTWALFCALAWVAGETIQSHLFTGFPWNLLGASHSSLLLLTQIAAFTGVSGVSFLIVWGSVALWLTASEIAKAPSKRLAWQRELAVPMTAVFLVAAYGWQQLHATSPADQELRVALVQPSIPQTMIWDENASSQRLSKLFELSRGAMTEKPDLLVWPEAALPYPIRFEAELYLGLTRLLTNTSTWMVFGSDDISLTPVTAPVQATNYYNSAFLLSPTGELAAHYAKRQLVIFGEYVPLVKWLPFLRWFTPITGGFSAGEERVSFEILSRRLRFSPLICFEDMFARVVRDQAQEDCQFLLNITNDGWFGESAQQWQHTTSAAFRAIENGIPLVRCSNNGITCWVDARGRLFGSEFESGISPYGEGVKHFTVPLRHVPKESWTFYRKHGEVFSWSCTLLVMTIGLPVWIRSRRPQAAGPNPSPLT